MHIINSLVKHFYITDTMSHSDTPFVHVVSTRMLRRKCIDSFSLILHTVIDGKIYYLIGRVRDTIPFKEFVRGAIGEADMPRYMIHMAQEEKHRLLTEPFQELLDDIMVNHTTRTYRSCCDNGAEFEINRTKYSALLGDPLIGLKEAPWIFPKGRKMEPETDIACALREFEEETRIPGELIKIYDEAEPLEEIYTGLDGKTYRTVYYMGYIEYSNYQGISANMRKQFIVTNRRTSLSEEIAKIKWLQYDAAMLKLDPTKRYLLRVVDAFLIFHLDRRAPRRSVSV